MLSSQTHHVLSKSLIRKMSVQGCILFTRKWTSSFPVFPSLLSLSAFLYCQITFSSILYKKNDSTHRSPPQGIGIGGKVLVEFFLHQINQERGEDEHQEADVPGSHQLLQRAPTQYWHSQTVIVWISEPSPQYVFSRRYCSNLQYCWVFHSSPWKPLSPTTNRSSSNIVKNLLCEPGLKEPAYCWCMFGATQSFCPSGSPPYSGLLLLLWIYSRTNVVNEVLPYCVHTPQIPAASKCLPCGPCAPCAGSEGIWGYVAQRSQRCYPDYRLKPQQRKRWAQWCLWG